MTLKLFGLKNCDTCKKALAELEAAMPRWTTEVVTQEAAPAGSAMRRAIDAGQHVIGMLWKHSEALRERIDLAAEKADAVLSAQPQPTTAAPATVRQGDEVLRQYIGDTDDAAKSGELNNDENALRELCRRMLTWGNGGA